MLHLALPAIKVFAFETNNEHNCFEIKREKGELRRSIF
jgi:hypothetical protein